MVLSVSIHELRKPFKVTFAAGKVQPRKAGPGQSMEELLLTRDVKLIINQRLDSLHGKHVREYERFHLNYKRPLIMFCVRLKQSNSPAISFDIQIVLLFRLSSRSSQSQRATPVEEVNLELGYWSVNKDQQLIFRDCPCLIGR